MVKSMDHSRGRKSNVGALANPIAFALKDRRYRNRIVKSKVKYDRKRDCKWSTKSID